MEKFKPAIKYGVILAVISIVVFMLQYALMADSFGNMTGWLIQGVVFFLALPIVFLILGARDCKPNFKPYTFGNAFLAAFITGVSSALFVLVFNIIFATVIDPGFDDMIKDKVMEKQEAQFEANKGIAGKAKQTGYGLVWYGILALIIGAVQKDKKNPELQDSIA